MSAYTDEAFADAIRALRAAVEDLARIRDAIDWNEPIREGIEEQLRSLERVADELERILEAASQELI